jgi:molecular chaperone DnaK
MCNLLYDEVQASVLYGHLVREVVDRAALLLGQRPNGVVLTVPASAEDRFRVQARQAVETHDLTVTRLLNQPAAALSAAQLPLDTRFVALVNCGGGTTEVTLAERTDRVTRICATVGDPCLGGEDMVWAVTEGVNRRLSNTAGVDVVTVGQSKAALFGLRAAAEEALQTLCLAQETRLVLDHGGGFGRDLVTVVRRADVDQWLAPLIERIGILCVRALHAGGWAVTEIDEVLLIGDWAHLPQVRECVANTFRRPVAQVQNRDAALLPVFGAALAARETWEAVWDVTPYALGINCYYGQAELFSPIIAANTPIPTPSIGTPGAYTEPYQTRFPDQKSVTLDVLQYRGWRDSDPRGSEPVRPEECELLGSWNFTGLRPEKGRHAPFTVTFGVDLDGILHLYARETATGHELLGQVNRGIG